MPGQKSLWRQSSGANKLRYAFLVEHRRPVYYRLLFAGLLEAHLKAIGSSVDAELDR